MALDGLAGHGGADRGAGARSRQDDGGEEGGLGPRGKPRLGAAAPLGYGRYVPLDAEQQGGGGDPRQDDRPGEAREARRRLSTGSEEPPPLEEPPAPVGGGDAKAVVSGKVARRH